MLYFLLFLMVVGSYVYGFVVISKRAKHIKELLKDDSCLNIYREVDERVVAIFGLGPNRSTQAQYLIFARVIHVIWFILSPIWVDIFVLIQFFKNVVPKVGMVFETDFSFEGSNSKIEELQRQIEELKAKQDKES